MTRILLALSIVAMVALAGCAGDGGEEATSSSSQSSSSSSSSTGSSTSSSSSSGPTEIALLSNFHIEGCEGVQVQQATEAAYVESHVDARFTITAESPGDGVYLTTWSIYNCEGFVTSTTTVNDTVFGIHEVDVQAPDFSGHNTAQGDGKYILSMIAKEDILAVLWEAASMPVLKANGTLTLAEPPLGVTTVSFGTYMANAVSAPLSMGAEPNGPFQRFYDRQDGLGIMSWTGIASTTATLDLVGTSNAPGGAMALGGADPTRVLGVVADYETQDENLVLWSDSNS